MTRDIANRFNNVFGDTFVIPNPDIEVNVQLIPGIDGKKMSKSYNNTIPIFDTEKNIRKKIMRIITDTSDIDEPKDKDTSLYQLYSLFLNSEEKKILSDRYDAGGLRYGDIKLEFYDRIMDYFQPFREKRKKLVNNPKDVNDILQYGAKKAKLIANEVIDRVRTSCGIII